MSDFHRHAAWGRVRRPKNILGPDGFVATGASGVAGISSIKIGVNGDAPLNDLTGAITGAALNTSTGVVTLTVGGGELDATVVGESVITRNFHPAIDGRLLPITAANDVANTISFKLPPDGLSQNVINSLTLFPRGTVTRQTVQGSKTENARYLHLFLQDTTAGGVTVTVYGYNYAFGRWAVLQLPAGFDTGDAQAINDPTAVAGENNDVTQAAVAASTAESSYVDAQFTAVAAAKTHIIPIAGIDKVYFVSSAANDADVDIGAAISTF